MSLSEDLREALVRMRGSMVAASKDWSTYGPDAALYGVLVGWDCEETHQHDEVCGGQSATLEVGFQHHWSPQVVRELRRFRRAIRAVQDGTTGVVDHAEPAGYSGAELRDLEEADDAADWRPSTDEVIAGD